ncbi:MAG TPA: aminotransferase DegT [Firmicutes bacterium]|jgi:perosamine synthetase|nr:aminotransferase DegT [Bacillota bacterium]
MSNSILLDAPNLGALEKTYLNKALDSNYVSTVGPFVPEFETKFASYLKAGGAVAVQSGTAAIHMALYELGIKAGDEVIVPAITFIATVNPIVYVGATPIFVDIDSNSWNIDPKALRKAITPKTKAIIPVHLYGNPCNMAEIMDIAKQYGLFVVEDSTESLGASYGGKATGIFGDMGCFSFNGNKVITTGGGGMVTTTDPERAAHIKFLVNQARDAGRDYYYHPEIGFNNRMTNLEAALGLAQFERLSEFLSKKRQFYQEYQRILGGDNRLSLQQELPGAISSVWMSSVRFNSHRVDLTIPEIMAKLKEKGVPSRRIFQPLFDSPPYQKYKSEDYSNAYELFENGLNLPSSTLNSIEDIRYTAISLLEILDSI